MKINRMILKRTAVAGLLSVLLLLSGGAPVQAEFQDDILRIGGLDYSGQQENTFYVLNQNLKVLENLAGVSFEDLSDEAISFTNEGFLSQVEQMIEEGTDGILICPTTDQVLPAVCRMCEEAQIYWGIYFREIRDDEIRKLCEASPYYIGNTYEAEEEGAYELMKLVINDGYKKIALITETSWDTACEQREQGIQRAIDETEDVEIVAEVRQLKSTDNIRESVKCLLEAYPDLDCIYMVGSTVIDSQSGVLKAIEEMKGDRELGLVTIDFSNCLVQDFESGILKAAYGLPQLTMDPYYLALKMVNTLRGYPLEDHSTSHCLNGVMVASGQEAADMADVIENWNMLYFPEDYVEHTLLKWNNPSLDGEEFQRIIDENRRLEHSVTAY